MKIQNEIFNGIEYTLVDVYELDNNKIYHFLSDDDELFCVKDVQEKYIIIENEEKIERIKEENGLIMPEVLFAWKYPVDVIRLLGVTNIKKVDYTVRERIMQETEDALNKLEEVNGNLNLKEKLKEIDYYTAESSIAGAEAFYHPATFGIFFDKSNINAQSLDMKRTRTHETIHAFRRDFTLSDRKHGIAEGGTESIVDNIFGAKRSSKVGVMDVNVSPDCCYRENVALIRQMESALGRTSVEEFLDIKRDFFKEFGKKYGKDLLRFIFHRTNRLLKGSFKDKDAHTKYFDETQNTILERVFDRDFESINNFEDAEMYFEKLRKFELTRGKIKGNNYFEQYYDDKLNKAKELLMEQGLDISKIDEFLEKYKYQEQEFYPARDREEIIKIIQNESSLVCTKMNIQEIYKIENGNNQMLSGEDAVKKIKGMWAENPQSPNGGYIFVLTYDNNPLSVHVYDKHTRGGGDIVYKQEKINQKNEDCPTVSDNEGKHFIKIPGSDETLQLEEIQFADNVNEKLINEFDVYMSKINNQQLNQGSSNQNHNSKNILAKILKLGINRKVTTEEVQKAASDVLAKQHDKSISIETDEK